MEVWKEIFIGKNIYLISSLGNIKSIIRNKNYINKCIKFYKDTFHCKNKSQIAKEYNISRETVSLRIKTAKTELQNDK